MLRAEGARLGFIDESAKLFDEIPTQPSMNELTTRDGQESWILRLLDISRGSASAFSSYLFAFWRFLRFFFCQERGVALFRPRKWNSLMELTVRLFPIRHVRILFWSSSRLSREENKLSRAHRTRPLGTVASNNSSIFIRFASHWSRAWVGIECSRQSTRGRVTRASNET